MPPLEGLQRKMQPSRMITASAATVYDAEHVVSTTHVRRAWRSGIMRWAGTASRPPADLAVHCLASSGFPVVADRFGLEVDGPLLPFLVVTLHRDQASPRRDDDHDHYDREVGSEIWMNPSASTSRTVQVEHGGQQEGYPREGAHRHLFVSHGSTLRGYTETSEPKSHPLSIGRT